jgi:hypothetical protein
MGVRTEKSCPPGKTRTALYTGNNIAPARAGQISTPFFPTSALGLSQMFFKNQKSNVRRFRRVVSDFTTPGYKTPPYLAVNQRKIIENHTEGIVFRSLPPRGIRQQCVVEGMSISDTRN